MCRVEDAIIDDLNALSGSVLCPNFDKSSIQLVKPRHVLMISYLDLEDAEMDDLSELEYYVLVAAFLWEVSKMRPNERRKAENRMKCRKGELTLEYFFN